MAAELTWHTGCAGEYLKIHIAWFDENNRELAVSLCSECDGISSEDYCPECHGALYSFVCPNQCRAADLWPPDPAPAAAESQEAQQ